MKRILSAILTLLCISVLLSAFYGCNTGKITNEEINEFINNAGYGCVIDSVLTPNRSIVEALIYPSMSQNEIRNINAEVERYISENNLNAQKIGDPARYNCHSYAWHSQAANNKYWINKTKRGSSEPNLSKYWTDESYYLLRMVTDGSIPSSMPNGCKVYYANGDHSAIKESNTKFVSKWGFAGLYRHSPKDAPYDWSNLSYYKKALNKPTPQPLDCSDRAFVLSK